MKNIKHIIGSLNITLIAMMILHIGVKMYYHGQEIGNSSPVYVELINAIYYIVPLLIVNVVGLLMKKK